VSCSACPERESVKQLFKGVWTGSRLSVDTADLALFVTIQSFCRSKIVRVTLSLSLSLLSDSVTFYFQSPNAINHFSINSLSLHSSNDFDTC
jgi:hypothetical protein